MVKSMMVWWLGLCGIGILLAFGLWVYKGVMNCDANGWTPAAVQRFWLQGLFIGILIVPLGMGHCYVDMEEALARQANSPYLEAEEHPSSLFPLIQGEELMVGQYYTLAQPVHFYIEPDVINPDPTLQQLPKNTPIHVKHEYMQRNGRIWYQVQLLNMNRTDRNATAVGWIPKENIRTMES